VLNYIQESKEKTKENQETEKKMNTLLSTTQFTGQMGYQKVSNEKLHNVTHKKASWFAKHASKK
jgi:trehalose-6-phosphate synthase